MTDRPTSAQRRLPARPDQQPQQQQRQQRKSKSSSSSTGTATQSSSASSSAKDLWKIAQHQAAREKAKDAEERTVLFVGSQSGGKSTMILRFLDREVAPKPTVALEYTFGRRARGHDLTAIKRAPHPSASDVSVSQRIRSLCVVLVVDLSQPQQLWTTSEALLSSVRRRIDKVIDDLNRRESKLPAYLKKKSVSRYGDDHPDLPMIQPLLVPLLIVGTKYDVFQNFDSERRKTIARTLRFLAHFHGGSLIFTSQEESLMVRCRAQLANFAFKIPFNVRSAHFDHNKPLLIPVGADSLESIGAPPQAAGQAALSARTPLGLWKGAFTEIFPQDGVDMDRPEADDKTDPAQDTRYKEPAIDEARQRKMQELERYKRHADRRR
ncbi:hypothetical protein PTSG_08780 [Salpingoeca rosetta]|uniref:Cytoplasmic dynein 2 light intermediate chain 1 n=1 Tax=Salpingoeca rosetta (strain ATCC 50818 / BSB-021) TaxID=946362 RepID=F2UKP0_SALR5|nr:uncharacterized protein PTSG_08780 [Salpingoeca rosetta]EGD77689.1 hypothetical protein PTSG_08780 [Salpingoeca rosetta]|eukprot:XP_004990165.1 hypothetical protein PTSG_08780 [Salpingoeca rosetta]